QNGQQVQVQRLLDLNCKKVQVNIRPEKIRLAQCGAGRLDGVVKTRLFLGANWMLDVETRLGLIRVSVPNKDAYAPEEGTNVGAVWDDHDLRLVALGEN